MKRISKRTTAKDGVLSHYDFSNGVRGKYAEKYREGVTVELREDRFVKLDDDLKKVFPDSNSVNNALRHLVQALPKRKRAS
jgi:hypothetical protein